LGWIECNYCFLFINKKEFSLQKPLRRRLGPDNRLKDERGNRRERDNRANGSEKYDRSENPQSSDFQSNNNGLDGGNLDEPMYETFGRQGMRVAPPFPSDIPPPPVLMPVPGAGYVDCASKM
jgi:hypothetical protein